MSNNQLSKTYTYWELIEDYSIEIPIIQRDYVQGRKKEEKVRGNFLNAIYEKLENKQELHLDFIYGVIKNKKFIPLDGQQRLTTLFLLHYYLSLISKENKFENFQKHLRDKNNHIKFSYEVRDSSKEFCQQLIDKKVELVKDKFISKIIEDENWFFSKWKQDPTIASMLIMLDNIQNIFKQEDLYELLKTNIKFSFLNPEELKIKNSNELYIKMNSRGKPLNEFENFKSYFVSFLKDPEKIKFDNEWFDIFWKMKKDSLKTDNISENEIIIEKDIFGAYLNFFKNITAFYSKEFNNVDIFKFDYKIKIDEITKILDFLQTYKNNIVKELRPYEKFKINIFQDFISIDFSKADYEKRLRFYALIKFYIKIGEIKDNENLFKQWIRVCLNIINNSIYNNIKDFNRDVNLIDELIGDLNNNFYKALSTSIYLNSNQFKEEKIKAALIYANSNWEKNFIEAEKYLYLDGQIGFLIDFSKSKNNEFVIGDFIRYYDKFKKLWDYGNKETKKQTLIHRALTTFNDYLPKHKNSNKYTFCSFGIALREKNENWRNVFTKPSFHQLLDEIKSIDNIETKLKKIIDNYKFDCKDFKSYYINPKKDWSPIEYARNYQIEFKNENNIYLNQGGTSPISWGWYRVYEFYSIYLVELIKEKKINYKPFEDIKPYSSSDLTNSYPCIYLNNLQYKSHNFAIDIKFIDKNFSIEFFDRNCEIDKIDYDLKKILENNFNFCELKEKRYINNNYDLCTIDDLISFIENFCEEVVGLINDPI